MNDTKQENEKSALPGGYLAAVGALVVVVMISLAVLWMTERMRRSTAEAELARLQRQYSQLGSTLAGGFFGGGGGPATRPAAGGDLPRKQITLDGRPREALLLAAEAGRRFGFRPGDVIIVSGAQTAPATAPASAPADRQPR